VLKELRAALDDLPEALGYGGRAQTLRGQRRSVHVEFDDEDFHLDVVPALIPDGIDEVLLVPDRTWGKWVESHPLGYGKALSALNAANGEKVVPLAKMVKHWRAFQMQRNRPKSYWLECLVYRHIDRGWVTTEGKSYAELFTDLLRSVHERFHKKLEEGGVPSIPDPMLGNNVAFNWERSAFESFMRRLDESIGWAEKALDKDREQFDEAIELWQKVFGEEYFTDSPALRKRQKAAWLGAAGGGWVGPSGGVSVDRPKKEKGVKSPKHGFYGHGGKGGRRPLTLQLQIARMRQLFPQFVYRVGNNPAWYGTLRPHDDSPEYRVKLEYRPGKSPKVWVLSPEIHDKAPHRYRDRSLCLYYPRHEEWHPGMFLAETIVPWAAEWLFFYEVWLEDPEGRWFGPEAPHGGRKEKPR
jgi:hypothetical protein